MPKPKRQVKELKNAIEVIKLRRELQDLEYKHMLAEATLNPPPPPERPKMITRDAVGNIQMAENALVVQEFNKDLAKKMPSQFADGNIMMEGPLDHSNARDPTERFMQLYIDPYKFAILARFTSIGHRLTFAVYEDAWAGGLSITLRGEGMEEKQKDKNKKLHDHWNEIGLQETWKLAGGFKREGGDSIIHLHFDGEIAGFTGKKRGGTMIYNFSYMERPAPPNKDVVKLEAYSKLDYRVIEDDGKGNPYMYQVTLFLGHMTGSQIINIHHSRVIQLKGKKVERGHEGLSIQQPCYNEAVIATMILKSMGEIAFRWSYGKPLIMTKGLNDVSLASFKTAIGNPTRDAWHILPAEWIEKFELLSNNTGNIDLPSYLDKLIDFCAVGTTVPKAIMLGDIQGVNTDNTVNNENYFAVLGKVHNEDEPKLLELFNKDMFSRKLLQGDVFDFNWGIRYSMSAEAKVDLETKEIANRVTEGNYMTVDERRKEQDLPPLVEVVENDPEYAKMLGNSLDSYTQFEKEQAKAQIENQKEIATIKANSKRGEMGKTVLGNKGKGKGKGVHHGEGKDKQRIKQPENKQTAKAKAVSRVRNSISESIIELRDVHEMTPQQIAKALETHKSKVYEMVQWKEEEDD